MQDRMHSHKFYQRACRGVLKIYLHLLDYPEDLEGLGHLSPADRKKERARLKKQREKEKKEADEKERKAAEEAQWSGEKPPGDGRVKDVEPSGEAYLTPTAPATFLTEAAAWVNTISPAALLGDPETLALATEVSLRRGRYVQALRALRCGLEMQPHHPALSVMLVKVRALSTHLAAI